MSALKGTIVLKRSKDRKVTPMSDSKGKVAVVANTFGLPASISCPGETPYCGAICYGKKIERYLPSVGRLLMHNWEALASRTREEMTALLAEMIAEFVDECTRKGAELMFRIHWDGDFFSIPYTQAWSDVIGAHPEVQFWTYTRFDEACALLAAREHENLSLYFSADRDNMPKAISLKRTFTNVHIALLEDTFEVAQGKYRAEFGRPAAMCPENTKQIPLITSAGGACKSCTLCTKGKTDVLFSVKKGR